jgi:hypothetical protein
MDADLQDPPEAVPLLLRRARDIDGTVFARRVGRYERWDRLITSRAFKYLLWSISGVPPEVGTFFAVPNRTARRMCTLDIRSPQVVVMAYLCSDRRDLLPVTRTARASGRSAYSSAARLRAAWRGVRCALECRGALGRAGSGVASRWPPVAQRVNA